MSNLAKVLVACGWRILVAKPAKDHALKRNWFGFSIASGGLYGRGHDIWGGFQLVPQWSAVPRARGLGASNLLHDYPAGESACPMQAKMVRGALNVMTQYPRTLSRTPTNFSWPLKTTDFEAPSLGMIFGGGRALISRVIHGPKLLMWVWAGATVHGATTCWCDK